jgi:hypothetical protein
MKYSIDCGGRGCYRVDMNTYDTSFNRGDVYQCWVGTVDDMYEDSHYFKI